MVTDDGQHVDRFTVLHLGAGLLAGLANTPGWVSIGLGTVVEALELKMRKQNPMAYGPKSVLNPALDAVTIGFGYWLGHVIDRRIKG